MNRKTKTTGIKILNDTFRRDRMILSTINPPAEATADINAEIIAFFPKAQNSRIA